MLNKFLFLIILTFFLNACGDNTAKNNNDTKYNFNQNVGWLHGHCLVIENSSLKPNDTVNIISLTKNQSHLQTKIKTKVKSEIDCVPLLSDRKEVNKKPNRSFYILDLSKENEEIIAIGVTNTNSKFRVTDGLIFTDLNRNGIPEYYSTCTGREGFNFSLTEKLNDSSRTLWESYYYLGYDITPDCDTSN